MSGRDFDNFDRERSLVSQAGLAARFGGRWRLIGVGLSNVWRFGDLELPAASGRLLFRGTNGTGKTTALETVVPYLLDLNAARLSAAKGRSTTLSSLMHEGATGKRRYGYAWLTFAGPKDEGVWSFGVRIQYSEGASPPVSVTPFTTPGRPLHEIGLFGPGRAALTAEQFTEVVVKSGGQLFESEEAYVSHLAARVFGTEQAEIAMLTSRLRQVRNPSLLGDVSPQTAADALRESLPGIAEDVIYATADALAESDATREAFERDKSAALLLQDFSTGWCSHATEVVASAHASAVNASKEARSFQALVSTRSTECKTAAIAAEEAKRDLGRLEDEIADAKTELNTLEKHQAYKDAGRLADLKNSIVVRRRCRRCFCSGVAQFRTIGR